MAAKIDNIPVTHQSAAHMHTIASNWREALTIALQRVFRIDHDIDAAPYVLHEISGRRLPALDEALRRTSWKPTVPSELWPLAMTSSEEEINAPLFCAGCHGDGRLRERALRLMRERPGRLATALALLRCDDWVRQVRDCAEASLRQIIATDPAALFAHFDLLLMLRARSRMQGGAWHRLIEPALLDPSHHTQRWAAFDSGSGKSRLFACTLILRADPKQAEALALRTLQHRDPVIACWGLRDLPRLSGVSLDETMLALALRHPHASVRAHALRARARHPDATYRALIQAYLLDPSTSVRNVAAYATRALGLEPRKSWRDALDQNIEPQNRNALLALSDCAEAIDLGRIAPWLQHRNGELRCAALRAALRCGIDEPVAHLRSALTSSSTKVVAVALKLGTTVPAFMTRETLSNAYASAANNGARSRIIDATRQLDRWQALDCLLDCITHAPYANDTLSALLAWERESGHRFAPLSADRKRTLLQRIDTMTPLNMHIAWLPTRRLVELA